MQIQTNICNGTTYTLAAGDSLDDLPEEFAKEISSDTASAFDSPMTCFDRISNSTSSKSFAKLISHYSATNLWALEVAEIFVPYREICAAFRLTSKNGYDLWIRPGTAHTRIDAYQEVCRFVSWINWGGIACSGELFLPHEGPTLEDFGYETANPLFPVQTTRVFGNSPGGDAMIYNAEGVAGYLTHETFASYEFGTLSNMLDWVFDKLSSDEWPEFEWDRVNSE